MAMTSTSQGGSHRWSLPNLLTYGRIVAVPLVVACMFWPRVDGMRWASFALFVTAAVTDFFDGYLARMWSQQSALGRMLDPIADKLLVAAMLFMLVADRTIVGMTVVAGIVILCREILVSGLREFLAELKVSLPVSKVAKWKAAAQHPDRAGAALDRGYPHHLYGVGLSALGHSPHHRAGRIVT